MVGRIKRGDVFLHTNAYGQSCYRMVVSTSMDGVSFISFTSNEEIYSNIPSIYVQELGYARIDRVDFVRWIKVTKFDLRKVMEISGDVYSNIIYRYFEFMNGNIYMDDKDNILHYKNPNQIPDMCVPYNEYTRMRQKEGIAIAKQQGKYNGRKPVEYPDFDSVIAQWRAGEITAVEGMERLGMSRTTFYRRVKEMNTEAVNDPEDVMDTNLGLIDYDYEVGMVDNADGDPITANTNEVEDYDDDFEECTGIDNKHDYNAMTKNAGHAKYIDLFEHVDSRNRTKSGYSPYDSEYAISKKSTSRSKTKHKPIYVSEEDVVRIALSNSTAISKEFNVSKYIANKFILNCKRRLGIDDRFISDPVHLCHLFDQGYTVEQVVKLTGLSKSSVNQSYKWWEVSRSTNDDDNKSALEKWNAIFDNNDFSTMLIYSKMTINEFAKTERCTQSIASTIYCRIHDELCRNVYYLMQVVDEEQKYNAENTMKYIEGVKKRKFKDPDIYDAVQYAVNTVESLRDIYIKTYDDHNDIIVGAKPIPDEVGDEKEAFITMISNRFHHNVLLSQNRTYTNYQKMLLETGGKISDFIAAFLIIDVDKVATMVGNCNRKRKNIK